MAGALTREAPLIEDTEALTLLDRCDRCGAQAKVRITLTTMHELMLCGNHFHKHEEDLIPKILTIRDEREWVLQRPRAKEGAS